MRRPHPERRPPDPLAGIEISPEYERVRSLVEAGAPVVFVSGRAGTGKSVLVQYLRHVLQGNIAVLAPTGVAALNVGGVTIHSFFRLPPHVITRDDIKRVADRRLYTALNVLLIDEVSMVRADVLDGIGAFLALNGPDDTKPFGGVQLVLVGDLFQLPPVVDRAEQRVLTGRYASPFFFSAEVLQKLQLYPVELTKVYRQADAEFVALLDQVRAAKDVESVLDRINAACAPRQDQPAAITLTCTNARADRINSGRLAELPGPAAEFVGDTSGRFALEDAKLPSPLKLTLKPGSQVMFTKNDEQHRWVNGTLGTVVGFKRGSVGVEIRGDHGNAVHDVQRVTWETYKYEYDERDERIKATVAGSYTQVPLMLAWAVTIHKGQGKTLEKVRIDLGRGAFEAGQVYVALSRCRSLADITLTRPIQPQEVRCDERIRRFQQAIADGLARNDP
ncbi:MAG: AAA family ATPase [Acidobacteria bacterium]|nr:AAA family ATPase [Acidobacteriota bacterium]